MPTTSTAPTVTVHDVLASRYPGGRNAKLENTLTHASVDDGRTALCNRVAADSLADIAHGPITCKRCLSKVSKLESSK
jgi:hypothetical protein